MAGGEDGSATGNVTPAPPGDAKVGDNSGAGVVKSFLRPVGRI